MYLCKHCNFQTMHKELMTRHTDTAQHSPKEPTMLTLPEKLVELDRIIRSDAFHKFYSEEIVDPMIEYTAEYQKTLMQLFEKFL